VTIPTGTSVTRAWRPRAEGERCETYSAARCPCPAALQLRPRRSGRNNLDVPRAAEQPRASTALLGRGHIAPRMRPGSHVAVLCPGGAQSREHPVPQRKGSIGVPSYTPPSSFRGREAPSCKRKLEVLPVAAPRAASPLSLRCLRHAALLRRAPVSPLVDPRVKLHHSGCQAAPSIFRVGLTGRTNSAVHALIGGHADILRASLLTGQPAVVRRSLSPSQQPASSRSQAGGSTSVFSQLAEPTETGHRPDVTQCPPAESCCRRSRLPPRPVAAALSHERMPGQRAREASQRASRPPLHVSRLRRSARHLVRPARAASTTHTEHHFLFFVSSA